MPSIPNDGLTYVCKELPHVASERLALFLDLGEMPPADQFLHKHQLREHRDAYPLQVAVCEDCGLIQLNYVVPPEILYCDDYPYELSTTSAGRRHWGEFARTTTRLLDLTANDLVVDIGSNVGVLLQMFLKHLQQNADVAADVDDEIVRGQIEQPRRGARELAPMPAAGRGGR